jgi:Domain of unknown function (DUF4328)
MNDIWVCSQCSSVNRSRSSGCYKCKAPQSQATGAMAGVRVESAIANRMYVRYRSGRFLFVMAAGLILAVAGLGLLLTLASLADIDDARGVIAALASGATVDDAAILERSNRLADPELVHLGLAIAAVIAFGLWLSRVISNIPALGGGRPGTTPTRAFVYTLIPVWNLFKVPGMIQDALYRLDSRAGGFWMVMIAWFGLVGSWIVAFFANIVIGISLASDIERAVEAKSRQAAGDALLGALDQTVVVGVVTSVMVVVGAVILVLVMARIERRARVRDKEIRIAAAATVPLSDLEPRVEAPQPGTSAVEPAD